MHAYLLIGTNNQKLKNKSEELATKLGAKILEYPIVKIEDVRNLNNLVRLTLTEPTVIFCQNIERAGIEALNAFLKNLEEPQENLYFILTASSTQKVLPTIVSRCQVIRVVSSEKLSFDSEGVEKFINAKIGGRLNYIDKIKDRDDAVKFAENLVFFLHSRLHENDVKYGEVSKNIEVASETLTRLKANGNVNLQLTNLVVNYG